MNSTNPAWSRLEVEAIVADYLDMLASELAGVPYNKARHARALANKLDARSHGSIEFKHCNISAALIEAGFPYISGYKPRWNYQDLIAEIIAGQLLSNPDLNRLAEQNTDRATVVPQLDNLLAIMKPLPTMQPSVPHARQSAVRGIPSPINYFERESRNRSLGLSGEKLVIAFETERLTAAGCERLAAKIEHTSQVRGDHEGFDILSFETDGRERLIEVKTTRYGQSTPFFVTRNELETSVTRSPFYRLYRLYDFQRQASMYELAGSLNRTCTMRPQTFMAWPLPLVES